MNTHFSQFEGLSDALLNIGALKQQVVAISQDMSDVETLRYRLRRLKANEVLSRSVLARDFVSKWEANLADDDFRLSQKEAESMARSCDELRFRMLSSALGACPEGFFEDAENSSYPSSNAIVHGRSGMCHATFGSYTILLMPDFKERSLCDLVAADLEEVYNSSEGQRSNWVIDFSSVEHAPSILLMGYISALKGDLAKKNRFLALVWLKERLFASGFVKHLTPVFDLQLRGGHFFSRVVAQI